VPWARPQLEVFQPEVSRLRQRAQIGSAEHRETIVCLPAAASG